MKQQVSPTEAEQLIISAVNEDCAHKLGVCTIMHTIAASSGIHLPRTLLPISCTFTFPMAFNFVIQPQKQSNGFRRHHLASTSIGLPTAMINCMGLDFPSGQLSMMRQENGLALGWFQAIAWQILLPTYFSASLRNMAVCATHSHFAYQCKAEYFL
jgi:hypothetical protein